MSELMGVIDAIEAMIRDSNKIPMTGKIVVEEHKLCFLVQKLRQAVQDGEAMIRKSIEVGAVPAKVTYSESVTTIPDMSDLPVIEDAMRRAAKIRSGADEYADTVLAQLQLVVSKLAVEISKMDRNIEKGRDVLTQKESPL